MKKWTVTSQVAHKNLFLATLKLHIYFYFIWSFRQQKLFLVCAVEVSFCSFFAFRPRRDYNMELMKSLEQCGKIWGQIFLDFLFISFIYSRFEIVTDVAQVVLFFCWEQITNVES
jgi:hypothetical protein